MARLDRLPRLLVAGHVNVDRLLRVRRFPEPDRTVPVLAEREELGGTATNLARVARRLGVPVGILARVGDGFPSRFRRELRDEGIDLRGLQEVRGLPTPCCTIVETPEGTSRTFIQQGPMEGAHAGELPGPWWRSYRWVHLGTGEPERTVRLARAAHAENRRVALDPAQEIFYRWDRERFRTVLPCADLLFGNRAEIDRAAGLLGGGSPARLLEKVPLVVRTEGPRGASRRRFAGAPAREGPPGREDGRAPRCQRVLPGRARARLDPSADPSAHARGGRGRLPGRFLRDVVRGRTPRHLPRGRQRCRASLDRGPLLGRGRVRKRISSDD